MIRPSGCKRASDDMLPPLNLTESYQRAHESEFKSIHRLHTLLALAISRPRLRCIQYHCNKY
eukprot:1915121-Amphidinium_carterae.1